MASLCLFSEMSSFEKIDTSMKNESDIKTKVKNCQQLDLVNEVLSQNFPALVWLDLHINLCEWFNAKAVILEEQ